MPRRACGCTYSRLPAVRDVGDAIVSTMFPDAQNGRVPVVAVTGVNGKTTTTRLIAHLVRATGRRVGMTCTEGIYLDDRRLETGDCSGPQSAQAADEPQRRCSRGGNRSRRHPPSRLGF